MTEEMFDGHFHLPSRPDFELLIPPQEGALLDDIDFFCKHRCFYQGYAKFMATFKLRRMPITTMANAIERFKKYCSHPVKWQMKSDGLYLAGQRLAIKPLKKLPSQLFGRKVRRQ